MSSRKVMAAKNVFSAISYYLANSIIGFISRKAFSVYLGQELLGLNGLVISVISMLSLLELGIANSIGYSLYKPLQEGDEGQVKAIMSLFSRLYRYIGFAVAGIGFILIPFLPVFIKTTINQDYVVLVYVIFLMDTVLSYFMAYRRTIFVSAQKDYINKNADTVLYIVTGVLQIVIICVWQNYIASILIKSVFTIINNMYLYLKAGKLFPYLNDRRLNEKLPKDVKEQLINNIKALFVIKIASYCVFGTDNILLSAFADLSAVAIYSGYTLILGVVNNIFNKSFIQMTANIGNYLVTGDIENAYELYKKIYFMNYLITSYTSIAMLTLFNEFIGKVWLGENYIFPISVVAILIFNNYSRYITQCTEAFRNAAGLYSPRPYIKYLSLLEGIINLVASVFLAHFLDMGIYGIFLGTSISTVVSTICVPWLVYRFLFKKPLWEYFTKYFWYLLWATVGCVSSYALFMAVRGENPFINIVFGGIISLLIPIVLNYIIFGRTEEWKYCIDILRKIVNKVFKRAKI